MLGAGTVINPIIKIVTTVAILAAVGIFIVRPVLDTTDKAIDSAAEQVHRAQQQSQQASASMDLDFARSRAQGYISSLQSSWPPAARELHGCIAGADSEAQMERCADLGQRLVTVELSDHNFALSYADSLDAQGDGAGAERVRSCVKQADFRAGAMQHCRNLADDLLFG